MASGRPGYKYPMMYSVMILKPGVCHIRPRGSRKRRIPSMKKKNVDNCCSKACKTKTEISVICGILVFRSSMNLHGLNALTR
uniref:Uncharacterized protein n=1 Tax=Oryza punctata TaxID=4537 RepID=A0A0E0L786_ORYPU